MQSKGLLAMEGNSSLYVKTLPGLAVISIVVAEMFLLYHVTSQDHMLKKLSNFVGGNHS